MTWTRAEFVRTVGALIFGAGALKHVVNPNVLPLGDRTPDLDFPLSEDDLAQTIDALGRPETVDFITDDWVMMLCNSRGKVLAEHDAPGYGVHAKHIDVFSVESFYAQTMTTDVTLEFDPVTFPAVEMGHEIKIKLRSKSLGKIVDLPLQSMLVSNGGDITVETQGLRLT